MASLLRWVYMQDRRRQIAAPIGLRAVGFRPCVTHVTGSGIRSNGMCNAFRGPLENDLSSHKHIDRY